MASKMVWQRSAFPATPPLQPVVVDGHLPRKGTSKWPHGHDEKGSVGGIAPALFEKNHPPFTTSDPLPRTYPGQRSGAGMRAHRAPSRRSGRGTRPDTSAHHPRMSALAKTLSPTYKFHVTSLPFTTSATSASPELIYRLRFQAISAFRHGFSDLRMEFRVISIFRITAVATTLNGLPRLVSSRPKALTTGLHRMATTTAM